MTLEEFKKHKDADTPDLSDEELFEVKTKMEEFADLFFTMWLAEINNTNKKCYDE